MELTREERRQLRVEFLLSEANRLGMNLAPEDFAHEDFIEDLPEMYMTEEHIEKMRVAEQQFLAQRPAPAAPAPRRPVPVHAVANAVRLDGAIRTGVSAALKQRLLAYAPVERLYSLVMSWRLQRLGFATAEAFGGHMARYGCTCIKKTAGNPKETWEFSLDMYYHQKKEDAEKKRRRRKEVRTALRVARMAHRMDEVRRLATSAAGGGSDSEDERFDPTAALAAARGAGAAPAAAAPPSGSESIDADEIPAFADDHVQLVVCLIRRTPPRVGVRVEEAYFVVRDAAF